MEFRMLSQRQTPDYIVSRKGVESVLRIDSSFAEFF